MKKLKVGIIGLGGRGYGTMRDCLVLFDNIEITAVCDVYQDRVDRAVELVKEKMGNTPFATTDYHELLARQDVDAVYVPSSWESHIKISIDAMLAGKAVGCEVGGSYTVQECFDLVHTYEKTGTPFMLMENCCYNDKELLATAMARDGKFGNIVHCEGAYSHDLRSEISKGNINRHYRLRNYITRNCENYPTHELGPIAKLLNINRGNRMVSLVSVSSKALGLKEYIEENKLYESDPKLKDVVFNQGDVVTTIIKCNNGETVTIKLDTTLPRSYTRNFTVRGTKGSYFMDHNSVYLDGMKEYFETVDYIKDSIDNARDYYKDYLPDVWYNMTEEDKQRGHGGMDGIMFEAFFSAVMKGEPMPIDVYDAAAWMSITALSEESIAKGGAPVAIPDFTNGQWILRESADVMPLKKFERE